MSDLPPDQELDDLLRISRNLQAELSSLQARLRALEVRRASAKHSTEPPPALARSPHDTTLDPSPPPPPSHAQPRRPAPIVMEHEQSARDETDRRDVEQLIGQTWLNRVGAIVLLLAAAFFIKFAFDQGWLSPTTRVVLTAVVGLGMIGLGEFCLARHLRTFAVGILGCGVGVCYLAAFGAFNFYHLVGSNTAFFLYSAVTVLSTVVSVHGRLLPVAMIAVIGGSGTPIALSTGSNQQIALLTYVFILDVGFLTVGVFRRWNVLRILAWSGTLALFVGWYIDYYDDSSLWLTVGFCLLFYVLFHSEMFVAARRHSADRPRQIGALLHFNNAVFFVSIYGLAHGAASKWMGLFAVVCGGLQWLAAWRIQGWADNADHPTGAASASAREQLVRALWQDGAAMLALAAPLQFDRYMVSISWATQAAITFWFCRRFPQEWLRVKGTGILAASIVHLLAFDYPDPILSHIVWSIGHWALSWILLCVVFVSVCGYAGAASLTTRRTANGTDRFLGALLVAISTALMLGIFADQWERYVATWWWIGLTVLWWGIGTRAEAGKFVVVTLAAAVCVKFLSWDTLGAARNGMWREFQGIALNRVVITGLVIAVLTGLLQSTAARCAALSDNLFAKPREAMAVMALAAAVVVTWTMTFEFTRIFRFEHIRQSFEDPHLAMHVAISIGWSLNATALLIIGFVRDRKELRYGAILLFVLTLVKVSIVDISRLDMVYRIISFAVLGVLLLCASLMYQRRATRRSESSPAQDDSSHV